MMGPKKLSEVKTEIRTAFANEGMDVESWLDEQMAKLKNGPKKQADSDVVEALNLILAGLRRSVATKTTRRPRPAAAGKKGR